MVPLRRGLAFVLVAVAACTRTARPDRRDVAPLGEGLASYYGEDFRGRRTASGERFDPDARTAAHRTLAFGSCLLVEDLSNGRAVRVRVNDRGPFVAGRVLDLSESAARELDLVRRGVGRVRFWSC